jgi:hypothetical protein
MMTSYGKINPGGSIAMSQSQRAEAITAIEKRFQR